MDFSLTEDHLALRDAVQRFCDSEYPAHERGNPETAEQAQQRWSAMAELGLLGLPFDAELGGSDLGAVELMLVAEQLGRALGGGAWLSSVVLAGQLLAEAGTPEQCERWLPKLATGELRMALACSEADARYDIADVQTTAKRDGDSSATSRVGSAVVRPERYVASGRRHDSSIWQLDGRKSLVLDGDTADVVLVVARTSGARRDRDGSTIFAIDRATPGVRIQPFGTLDGRRAAHVELAEVRVGADRIVGPVDGALPLVEAALDRANAALVADAAGALDALLEQTVEHLKTRKQFGAPLAKFQVLQHRVADLLMALEQARSMACAAAMAADGDPLQRARIVSAAKALIGPLGRQAGMVAIQLHGAMGMTDECRIGHYAKRLMTINQLFGDAGHHLRRYAGAARA